MLLIYLIERKWKKNNKKTKWREKNIYQNLFTDQNLFIDQVTF